MPDKHHPIIISLLLLRLLLLVRLLLFPLLLRLRLLTIAAPACVALQVGPQRIAQHRPCPPPRLHVAR